MLNINIFSTLLSFGFEDSFSWTPSAFRAYFYLIQDLYKTPYIFIFLLPFQFPLGLILAFLHSSSKSRRKLFVFPEVALAHFCFINYQRVIRLYSPILKVALIAKSLIKYTVTGECGVTEDVMKLTFPWLDGDTDITIGLSHLWRVMRSGNDISCHLFLFSHFWYPLSFPITNNILRG